MFRLKVEHSELAIDKASFGRLYALLYWLNGGYVVLCNAGSGGVCMMRNTWRDEQHPSFINFISSFLNANSFRLNFVPIAPVILILCLFSVYFVVPSLIS